MTAARAQGAGAASNPARSRGRAVERRRLPGGFERCPIRRLPPAEVRLIAILPVEKGVERAQGRAKPIVAVIMAFRFALDPTVHLADPRGVRDFGSIGHRSVPARGGGRAAASGRRSPAALALSIDP